MTWLSLLLFAPHAQLCYVSVSFGTVDCSRPGFVEMRETAEDYYRPKPEGLIVAALTTPPHGGKQ